MEKLRKEDTNNIEKLQRIVFKGIACIRKEKLEK